MNIAEAAIRGKTVTLLFAFILLVAGLFSYEGLSRLEDPEFTIKKALVITPYPGANAQEVEEEVTDEIELAAQSLGQTKHVMSRSEPGLSIVEVEVKDKYGKEELPQVWDELRRKVGDAQRLLPPKAGPSLVNDDFGDVYGIFVGISGDEYTQAELTDYAEMLRKELLLVPDVAKIQLFAEQSEAVYIEISRDKMTSLGVAPSSIYRSLWQKNVVADAGRIHVGPEYISVEPTGAFETEQEIGSLLISEPGSDAIVRLGDVAEIRRGYLDPARVMMHVDGKRTVGLGISTVAGGNVVTMGTALRKRALELEGRRPLGMEFEIVAMQSEAVVTAISGFIVNLAEAVAIVIVVLLVFMGARSGMIIGGVLLLTIAGTFIFMDYFETSLERISLGALIIALGMLVDNAIVVVDGTLVGLKNGKTAAKASAEVVKQTSYPLLMATAVAILSFAAIGTSDDKTGEYCGSLFTVLFISLLLSWVTAVTITPLFCVMFLEPPKKTDGKADKKADDPPKEGAFLAGYRRFLRASIRLRWITVAVLIGVTVLAIQGFGNVEKSFFPDSTRPQFMVDYWMPRGTHIDDTRARLAEIEEFIAAQDGVTQIATVTGKGAPRFLLTYGAEKSDSSYGQLLVSVDSFERVDPLGELIQAELETTFTEGRGNTKKFLLGPGEGGKIQIRFSGPDPNVLRSLSSQAEEIMQADGGARGIRPDWRQRVKVVRPEIAEESARLNGIERGDVAAALLAAFEGRRVGVFRDGDDLLPILSRAPQAERADVGELEHLQIWSPFAAKFIPLRQVVSGFTTVVEDDLIQRRDRSRTITIHADQREGTASALLDRLMPQIDAIERPPGYQLEYGGEYESSRDAQGAMAGSIMLFTLAMIVVVIVLFNAIRQPLAIWLCVPLAIIGVTAGLLVTDNPFGFMALLGLLSLVGMLIKNAIVLIDQIDLEIREGKEPFRAIVDSAVGRVRPVGMAALTTMLGMIPLFTDAFFVAMAVTIVFGLGFATVLTLVVVPVFYAILFRIKYPSSARA